MNISFALTTRQFRERSKDVTRRLGWAKVRPGAILTAVEKAQGLKKGEHPVAIGKIRVTGVRRERLRRMADNQEYGCKEVVREGFPHMTPAVFVAMFCDHNGCTPSDYVTRIEFDYV